ncbi:MAG TPA: alkaline shock response membrane anchor protein AmaP [Clostridia bacterium]|nr:alkaline shock response membrane anchor protein AmaP [Clostridia bacterium]
MEIGDRVLLAVFAGGLVVHFGMTFLSMVGWAVPGKIIASIEKSPEGRTAISVVAFAFLLLSVRFFILTFRRKYGSKAVAHQGPLGEVRVYLGAIENLVKRVCRQVPGVREVKAHISNVGDSVSVFVRCSVSPDVSIPDLTRDLQKTVQTYVKNVVGVEVNEVKMVVENITTESKKSRGSAV